MTLIELIDSRKLRPLTKRLYRAAIGDFVAHAGSDPRSWTPASAMGWVSKLQRSSLKPQSINTKINALRTASKLWSKYMQDPRLHFAELLEQVPQVESGAKKHAVSYEQAQDMIDACRGDRPIDMRDRAMVTIGFKTGMRRMSLAALEFEKLDWSRRTIEIFVKGGRMHKMPPLDEETFAALEPWRDWLRKQGIRSGPFFRSLPGFVALGTSATVRGSISVDGVHKVLCGRARSAGVDGFTTHTFRHSFVTWMQELNQPSYVIQAYTGHRSDAMVLEYTDAWLRTSKQSPMELFGLKTS